MTIRDFEPGTVRASELYGEYWFNSDPIPVLAQRGNVILLDFWDYTCSASVRTVPYINDWFRKYSPDGLVVIGVHTPRFPFAKEPENVQKAIQRLAIKYPVVMDNEGMVWGRYENRLWPAEHVVDRNGFVRFVSSGGGNPLTTEHVIQTLMLDAGLIGDLPEQTAPLRNSDRPGAVCFRATPEMFAGYLRGSMGNVEGYSPESEMHYADPGLYLEGRFYVVGDWSNDRDELRMVGDGKGQVFLRYSALEVDAVIAAEDSRGLTVEVQQDGAPVGGEARGLDVQAAESGRTVITVREPRTYNVIRNREHGEHVLSLTVSKGGLSFYSFSFTAGAIPELISG